MTCKLNIIIDGMKGGKLMCRLVHYRSTVIGILYTIKCTAAIHPFSVFDETE
jgi:hypothetical protein